MKIFISWSGERSNKIAKVLFEYFSENLQLTKPWMSSNIEKGKKWHSEISGELSNSNFGLIILTPENLTSPWILFEAGALSKLDSGRVFTVLFDLKHNDVKPPLSQFQHTLFRMEDFKSLVFEINKCCLIENENQINNQTLQRIFEKSWSSLESEINTILETREVTQNVRTQEDKIDEILTISRKLERKCDTVQMNGKFYQRCSNGEWREVVNPMHEEQMKDFTLDLQKALNKFGYKVNEDNIFGTNTKNQLVKFQKDNNLPTGSLNIETLKRLGLV